MNALCRLLLANLLLAAALALHAETLQIVDDAGRVVRLAIPVQRIVTLAPHLAELVFAAGAGNRLVGASAHSDHPPAVAKLPVVGGPGRLDLERILLLKPDLVLAWGSGGQQLDVARLTALGIPVLVTEPQRLEDIARHIELIGRLAGTGYEAMRAAFQVREALRGLQNRYAGRAPVRVFYEIWHTPLMTVNGRHIISEAITLCGGRNVFADLAPLTPTVTMEALLAADPEVIVVSGERAQRDRLLAQWRGASRPVAAARGHIYFADADLMHRATPRMIDGIRQLCQDLEQARH
ncbi:cobalamin-binding protein [Thiobacter aerophilum]|uniref:Cobalamin-binding protein n=1 Tax=Thiobacter aerophilum TaxID=3121275 RepID=A0ABV0EKC0_9BURK